MALTVASLNELDQTKVDQMFALFTQYMQEKHPDVELTRGVFHDLVLYFNSALNASVQENIERVLQSRSLLQISANPALAEPELVDQVLSNFNLTRDVGRRAVGEATTVFNLPIPTTISQTIIFSAEGVEFQPAQTYVAVPPGTSNERELAEDEREMIAVGDGTYAVNILLQAVEIGVAGNIRRATELVPNFVPNNMREAFAAVDFVSGAEPASNADYLARLSAGLAAKTVGGRASYAAAVRSQAAFANVPHVSVLGCGDPEQHRDQHGLFPVSGGGRIDIYCQTHYAAQEKEHLLEAVYIGEGETGTRWQVTLGRDTAPGFYEVVRIVKPLDKTSTGFTIVRDERGWDVSEVDHAPDVMNVAESAYSRFQTAVIQFDDPATATSGLVVNSSRAYYAVTTVSLPLIDDIHDYLTSREIRSRAADVLVRAAVPCFTKISFTIRKEANTLAVDTDAIKRALVEEIQKIGFSGQLHSSIINGVTHRYLSGRQAVSEIDMFGRIRRPDGSIQYIRDNTLLAIPDDPGRMVTGRTTAFLVGPEDISISVATAGFAE